MKVKNSLRSLKQRHRDCRVVTRKGRVYVINKTQRRFKARQGELNSAFAKKYWLRSFKVYILGKFRAAVYRQVF